MEEIKINDDGSVILPQPDEIPRRDKEDAMGAYLMMVASWAPGLPVFIPFFSIIASLIYYYLNKTKSRFVNFHAYQSMITQFPISILNFFLVVWIIVLIVMQGKYFEYFLIYLLFTGIWNILYIIFSIIACVYARKGRFYYMLFFGRIAFNKFYGVRARERLTSKTDPQNRPPAGF